MKVYIVLEFDHHDYHATTKLVKAFDNEEMAKTFVKEKEKACECLMEYDYEEMDVYNILNNVEEIVNEPTR